MSRQTVYQELIHAWRQQARANPWLTRAFFATLALLLVLLVISAVHGLATQHIAHFRLALYGGTAGFMATSAGALLILLLGRLKHYLQDSMLGFAAGMMLAASAFSLILPGLEAAARLFSSSWISAGVVVLGIGLGTLLMLGMDSFTPHEHQSTGPCGPECQRISGIWLFVFAIALHNIPEGMAIGVSFAQGDMGVGLPLTTAIAIQDVPEGLAVAMALRLTGLSSWRSALLAAATGLLEVFGAVLGFSMASSLAIAYPLSMGIAAGAMIFVVSHEVIPETHRNGNQTAATVGLMGGFMVMMLLDTALG
ncbi:MAG: ZIP family metal transporter [Thiopseudomonas sp.]